MHVHNILCLRNVLSPQTKLSSACDWSIVSHVNLISQSQATDSLVRCSSQYVAQTLNIVGATKVMIKSARQRA